MTTLIFMRPFAAAVVLAITCLTALPQTPVLPPKAISVQGYVTDGTGQAMADSTVVIAASSAPGKPVIGRTDKEGYYKITINAGDNIDINYQHTEAGWALVTKLSGKRDQNISIVLYKSTQLGAMGPQAIMGELAAYEYAATIAQTENSELAEFMRRSLKRPETVKRIDLLARKIPDGNAAYRALLSRKFESYALIRPRGVEVKGTITKMEGTTITVRTAEDKQALDYQLSPFVKVIKIGKGEDKVEIMTGKSLANFKGLSDKGVSASVFTDTGSNISEIILRNAEKK
jgi:hypothetical protein